MKMLIGLLLLMPLAHAADEILDECLSKFSGHTGPYKKFSASYCDCLTKARDKGPEEKESCEKAFYLKNDFQQLCEIRTTEQYEKNRKFAPRQTMIIKEICICRRELAHRHRFSWEYAKSPQAETDRVECEKKIAGKYKK